MKRGKQTFLGMKKVRKKKENGEIALGGNLEIQEWNTDKKERRMNEISWKKGGK